LLEQAVSEKWLGQNFSERIWDDRDKLVGELRRTLSQAAVSHSGIEALTKKMAKAMGSSLDNARRLVRTELNYVANQATLEGYRQSGVKHYKFLAAIDSRTSDICRETNGQVFAVAEAEVGVNFPPLHPNCRSTTVAHFTDEDIAERYDYSHIQLSDEELAELGVSREDYLEATGQKKPGDKPIELTQREAQRAEDAVNKAPLEGESLRVNSRLERLGEDLRFERELEQTLDKGKVPHTEGTLEVRQQRLRELRGRLSKEELRVGELEQRAADALPMKRSRIGKMVAKARAGMERWKGYFNAMVERFLEAKSKLVVHGAPPSGNASPFADVTPVDTDIADIMATVASDEVDTQKLWDPAPAVAKYPVLGVLGDKLAVFDWDSADKAARAAVRRHAAELALMPENVLAYIAKNGGRIVIGGRPLEDMGQFLELGVDWGETVLRWNRPMRELPAVYLPPKNVALAGVGASHSSASVVLHESAHIVVSVAWLQADRVVMDLYQTLLSRNELPIYFRPLFPGDDEGCIEVLAETIASGLIAQKEARSFFGSDMVDYVMDHLRGL
jgi:SPP1 gp7 family putative phage head morphogenesis protein